MSNPTVSVILPVYNGENYLRFAVESVLNQTFQDFELLVIDDGSVDSTPSIAREYGQRVTYVQQENTGVAGAFNHGLRRARGRYISWLSHDDVFLPTKLARQVAALASFADPAVSYTDIQYIDSQGRVMSELTLPEHDRREALRHVLTGGLICCASYSVLYDRRCIETVGDYSETWPYTQDADMLAKLARHFPLVRVPEVLIQVREHDKRGVRSKNWEREVPRFFSEQLNAVPLPELFPEIGDDPPRAERVRACLWLADTLAARPFPFYHAAYSQYRRALNESPTAVARSLSQVSKLGWRHFRRHANRQNVLTRIRTLTTTRRG